MKKINGKLRRKLFTNDNQSNYLTYEDLLNKSENILTKLEQSKSYGIKRNSYRIKSIIRPINNYINSKKKKTK